MNLLTTWIWSHSPNQHIRNWIKNKNDGGGGGGGGGREAQEEGAIYTYGRFTLLYGRNEHNTVKQLSSNLK